MANLTVGELREMLDGLDDDIPVVGVGHFGEALNVDAFGIRDDVCKNWRDDRSKMTCFVLDYEDKGPDPE